MLDLPSHWYRQRMTFLAYLLLPLSWLFLLIISLRRFCYRKHIFRQQAFTVPVIVVGNVTVGGTGKTPFVIWLGNFLKENGWRPGIISRGVGGKASTVPLHVTKDT